MKTWKGYQLWRVDWVHRNGYRAPSKYVWAKTKKETHKLARESRLADFPDSWSYSLCCIGDD
tara:strand:+ start:111 stop:296 length:186 start_codon:yes stop_codon:yes gene_type:complete